MPTNLDRIQCLLQPEPFADVRTLADHNNRTLSAMAAELIDFALHSPKYRDQVEQAAVQVHAREDPRTRGRAQDWYVSVNPEQDSVTIPLAALKELLKGSAA